MATMPAGPEIKLLDHGYIKCVEFWGSDEDIVRAARMSTGKGFLGWGPKKECKYCHGEGKHLYDGMGGDVEVDCKHCVGDEKLLRYLYTNRHDTPFEMAGMIVEVQAPIFVFREWHRHRVPWSYNEASARYAPLPDLNYVPTIERLMRNAGGMNKQAGTVAGSEGLTEEAAREFQKSIEYTYAYVENVYQSALKKGVPKELARVVLPVGRYSKMRASSNLRGWFHFFGLRRAKNAQEEIRVYADAAFGVAKELFPRSCALFEEGFKG